MFLILKALTSSECINFTKLSFSPEMVERELEVLSVNPDSDTKNWIELLRKVFNPEDNLVFSNGKDITIIWGWKFENNSNQRSDLKKIVPTIDSNRTRDISDNSENPDDSFPPVIDPIPPIPNDEEEPDEPDIFKPYDFTREDLEVVPEEEREEEEIQEEEKAGFLEFLKEFAAKYWWLLVVLLAVISLVFFFKTV